MFKSKKDVTDVLSILVRCPEDDTVLLTNNAEIMDFWIPSKRLEDNNCYRDLALQLLQEVIKSDGFVEKLLKLVKVWTQEGPFYHVIMEVHVTLDVKSKYAGSHFGKAWWTYNSMMRKINSLRSLEILDFVQGNKLKKHLFKDSQLVQGETVPMGPFTEVTEKEVFINEQNAVSPSHQELIISAGFTPENQYSLYEEYFLLTYPCIYMSQGLFKKFLVNHHWNGDDAALFKTADVWKRQFLTFHDFLYLIAAMEPATPHSGASAKLRCQFIFRFYDADGDSKLNFEEFKNLIQGIHTAKSAFVSNTHLQEEVEYASKLIGFNNGSTMTFEQFLNWVGESKIRGTSLLLRFNRSVLIGGLVISKKEPFKRSKRATAASLLQYKGENRAKRLFSAPDYELCTHMVRLKNGYGIIDIVDICALQGATSKSMQSFALTRDDRRLPSLNLFNADNEASRALLVLKYFESKSAEENLNNERISDTKAPCTWGSADMDIVGTSILIICNNVRDILKNEPRLLKLQSPIYIMGDLHGSYHDLMRFEKALWKLGPSLIPANLLFLGDFVDRGPNSIEVVMYLFAHKIQNPRKVYLVRGNHELRDVQKLFTFQRECIAKFGIVLGTRVWGAVNGAFDVMPLSAVIDEKVFCCHGGIPPPWLCPHISVINQIQCPLDNCEKQSQLAWNLMWNDPVRSVPEIPSHVQLELAANEGFAANQRRGTAHVFSYEALERFLKMNNLSHVIRAHQVTPVGFQVSQNGKLLTVFSSSSYCGGKNFAASIFAGHGILRAFTIDTTT